MSTTNIDFYLNEIETSKKDIHQAIINKGGTPTGGLSSYADAINNIETPKLVTGPLDVLYKDNGSYKIEPSDYGFDAFDAVKVDIDVPQSGGDSKPQIPNGFRFTGGQMIPGQTIFGLYDWSLVYDLTNFFGSVLGGSVNFTGFTADDWKDFEQNFNGKILSADGMFAGCSSLTSVPQTLDTSKCVNTHDMFASCLNLTSVPEMDLSSCLNTRAMFNSCGSLTSISLLNVNKTTDAGYMFSGCSKLTSIPQLNTSNCTIMDYMFQNCSNLTSVPEMDTSNCTVMDYMFSGCGKLNEVRFKGNPQKVTSTSNMFYNAGNGTENPIFYYDSRYDYSKIINVLPSKWTAVPYDVEEYEATLNQL